jgi:hypothetical protein
LGLLNAVFAFSAAAEASTSAFFFTALVGCKNIIYVVFALHPSGETHQGFVLMTYGCIQKQELVEQKCLFKMASLFKSEQRLDFDEIWYGESLRRTNT